MLGPPPPPKPRPALPGGPYLVVGLARSGRAAALALARRGERVIGCDSGYPDGVEGLREAGVELHLDAGGVNHLEQVRTVVKSPGVTPWAPVVVAARDRGVPVLGEMELAWRLLPNRFVAVTGTNGKTTTAELIGHVLRSGGRHAEVAGNVGTALSELVGSCPPEATVVCEASSFQLEDSSELAPECAALLNFSPDHLDRHGSIEAYLDAKLRAFANQTASDVAVLNVDDPAMPAELPARTVGFCASDRPSRCEVTRVAGMIHAGGEPLIDVGDMQILGDHNVANAMAAAATALSLGMEPEEVSAGLASFTGVAHRLEPVGEVRGILFVNDSKATNVGAAVTALESFGGPVRAILGGSSKGEDFGALAGPAARHCSGCYLIGEAAPGIRRALLPLEAEGIPVRDCAGLADAVERAAADAAPGEVVLLSPGCASFDAFRDFEDRGESFKRLVEGLR